MIVLFTDFGLDGPYVGQMHAVFARHTSAPRVIDLMHDAPAFRSRPAGHLLAAMAGDFPDGTVFVGTVDPMVGTSRLPVVLEADGYWFVGPGNGLFDTFAARAESTQWWKITRRPERDCHTFHGRDLFAPVAAALARGEPVPGERIEPMHSAADGEDLREVIYIDGFGNAVTGIRGLGRESRALCAGSGEVTHGRTFADAEPGQPLWLINSIGLVEIAANQASAARHFGLEIGSSVAWAE